VVRAAICRRTLTSRRTAGLDHEPWINSAERAAGLESELDQLCCDLRFLAVRLRNAGPSAVEADLARSASPTAGRLRLAIAQNASLLAPVEPTAALITILTSRLGDVPELADQLPVLRTDLHAWTAWPTWRPPDLSPDG
jgi:hypothetical protein